MKLFIYGSDMFYKLDVSISSPNPKLCFLCIDATLLDPQYSYTSNHIAYSLSVYIFDDGNTGK